jgi:hypothetical protein
MVLMKTMTRLRQVRWLSLLLLAAAWPQYLQAGSLEKVWEVELKAVLQPSPNQSFKVRSLSFSPDAQQIVVLLQNSTVLLQVQSPKTVAGQFQIRVGDSFGWSPDSQIIYSGRQVIHLADRKSCDLPQYSLFPHFIANETLVAMLPSGSPSHVRGTFEFPGYRILALYDTNCEEQARWAVEESWGITDASPERELLSVLELTGSFRSFLVDPVTRNILHYGPRPSAPRGSFANRGRVICADNTCWDVDTAKTIRQAPVSGSTSSLGSVAAHSTRVVLDDRHDSVIPFSSAFTELAARRRIWDFTSNKEVVSWPLKFITYWSSFDLDGFNRNRTPIPGAISPDGEYVVEGGDGRIWLYKVQP